jgi:diguanylate cyclase (GGDEF)-like protein
MAASGAARIADVSEAQLRTAMVKAGVWLTYGICAASVLYFGATWDQPHRSFIFTLIGLAVVGGAAVQLAPTDRIVRGRFAEPFFFVWSALDVAIVTVIVAADGGVTSPFAGVFFPPLIFAALFYPVRLFVPVGALVVFGYVGATAFGGNPPEPTHVGLITTALATVAVMCAWHAQNHERDRTLLNLISRTDPLTNTLNRRGFEELVESALAAAGRSGQPVTLMMLDLDGFKKVNDSHGHAVGDELLAWVAQGISTSVRPLDSVGRLGGDEFAVLAPGIARPEAQAMGQRVGDVLAAKIRVTSGIACFPEDGSEPDELYRTADRDLYLRKQVGAGYTANEHDLGWAQTVAAAVMSRLGGDCDQSRVRRYAAGLARRKGWRGAELESFVLAAMVHDVGKLPVPDRILQKPGPLDPVEYEEVKRHLVRGAEMVARVEGMTAIAAWLRHAQENWDGTGYPDGLAGEAIPLPARMLRVVSAFHAMTSARPYRDPLSSEEALDQLGRNAGRQFDPGCVEDFEGYLLGEPVLAGSAT